MSKYAQRGAYHYKEFADPTSTYHKHVVDLVHQVMQFVSPKLLLPLVCEIGAGEGLILDRFEDEGLQCRGCDTDPVAVELARKRGNRVELGSVEIFKDQRFDVVLLCDVLEHVPSPSHVMTEAMELTRGVVVIAIPDRKDPHAINEPNPDAFVAFMEHGGFACVHRSQRHARHLMIFAQ